MSARELLFKGEVIYGDTGTNPRACQIGVRAFVRTTTLRKYVFQFSGRVHTQTSLYLIRGTDLCAVLFPIFTKPEYILFHFEIHSFSTVAPFCSIKSPIVRDNSRF